MNTSYHLTRHSLVRRGLRLSLATIGYNSLEGVIAVAAGLAAGSVALVGFGVDSVIEVGASLTAIWRLRADADERRREEVERWSLRLIGLSFLGLAAYVVFDALRSLIGREPPSQSPIGIGLTALSLIVMPLLARAKRRVAAALGSSALTSEAQQTVFCTYLSAIVLTGLVLNATLGWWWADPAAALAMTPFIVREGIDGMRGRACSDAACCP